MNWWHAYGPADDGSFHVHGPSAATPVQGSTLGDIIGLPYVDSFDHEPTPEELAAAAA